MKLLFVLPLLLILSACVTKAPPTVFINPSKPLSCKQLEERISALEAKPKTEAYTNNDTVHYTFKNQYTDQLKAMKRTAAKRGCYDRPAYIEPLPNNTAQSPTTVPTQRLQLTFEQCYEKCKSLTPRSNEQCFDSCK